MSDGAGLGYWIEGDGGAMVAVTVVGGCPSADDRVNLILTDGAGRYWTGEIDGAGRVRLGHGPVDVEYALRMAEAVLKGVELRVPVARQLLDVALAAVVAGRLAGANEESSE